LVASFPSLLGLLVEIAAGIEAAMCRRIYIERINYPMLFKLDATALTRVKRVRRRPRPWAGGSRSRGRPSGI
jgi:hypothetical protein